MATESRLAPVPGPVPHSYSGSGEVQLPEAFTSTATHFTPIILTSEVDSEESGQHLRLPAEGLSNFYLNTYFQIVANTLLTVCDGLGYLPGVSCLLAVTRSLH